MQVAAADRLDEGKAVSRPSSRREPVHRSRVSFDGQEASMFFSAVSRSSEPLTQAVISFQNEPAPTSPGIRSEPSKRTLVAPARISATPRSMSLPYQSS